MKADEVAALCNVTRGRYYQWEAADRILKKNIPPLARALDLSEDYLTRVNNGHVHERSTDGDDPSEQAVSAA